MKARPSRREVLGGAGMLAAVGAALPLAGCGAIHAPKTAAGRRPSTDVVPFYGAHQAGIITPPQQRLLFASLRSPRRRSRRVADVAAALDGRGAAADRRATRRPGRAARTSAAPTDTGEAIELPASQAHDHRRARAQRVRRRARPRPARPRAPSSRRRSSRSPRSAAARTSIPPARTATSRCSAAPTTRTVAFHAFRNLARIGRDIVGVRWTQLGFGRAVVHGRADHAPQPAGLQGRHEQPRPERRRADARPRVGRGGRRAGVDDGRHVHGDAPHPHAARALGPLVARRPGRHDRPHQAVAARRSAA